MSQITTGESTEMLGYMVDAFVSDMEYTEDYPSLMGKPAWVFVYGTLMKDLGNHRLLKKGSAFIGTALTRGSDYMMYRNVGGSYPYVSQTSRTVKGQGGQHILGELYQVDLDTLSEIDRLEQNGFHYERHLHTVVWNYEDMPKDGKVSPKLVQAYMYTKHGGLPSDERFEDNTYTFCGSFPQTRFGGNPAFNYRLCDA